MMQSVPTSASPWQLNNAKLYNVSFLGDFCQKLSFEKVSDTFKELQKECKLIYKIPYTTPQIFSDLL